MKTFSNSKFASKIRALARLTRGQRVGARREIISEPRGLAKILRGERGQATSESAVLLLTTLLTIVGGGTYLLQSHSDWMNALSAHINGFYFVLSLPFP